MLTRQEFTIASHNLLVSSLLSISGLFSELASVSDPRDREFLRGDCFTANGDDDDDGDAVDPLGE